MTIQRIFVDMDGVLCDFNRGVASSANLSYDKALKDWVPGEWPVWKPLGMVNEIEMWEKYINPMGERFWTDLAEMPWAHKLWTICRTIAPTYILSSPSREPSSFSGKVKWLLAWKGKKFREYILTPHKEFLSKPGTVLIDDSDKNIANFSRHGGVGVQVPQIWNSQHEHKEDPIGYVMNQLDTLM